MSDPEPDDDPMNSYDEEEEDGYDEEEEQEGGEEAQESGETMDEEGQMIFFDEEDEGEGEDEDEDARMQESANDRTSSVGRPIEAWALGDGIHPQPPGNYVTTVGSPWAKWSSTHKIRPLQHLAVNVPLDFIATDAFAIGTCRSFSDEAVNNRSGAFAALIGWLFWDSYGIFIDKMGLIEEDDLTPAEQDPKARAAEIKAMKPVDGYTFWHVYQSIKVPVQTLANSTIIYENYNDLQFGTDVKVELTPEFHAAVEEYGDGCHVSLEKYAAPCEVMLTETLYAKRSESESRATASDGDQRGPPCAIRIHLLLFNKRHKPQNIVQRLENENRDMLRASRATCCVNSQRHEQNKKAAQIQRAMIVSKDVQATSMLKSHGIINARSLVNTLEMAAGKDCGGRLCSIYPDMEQQLGNGSMCMKIKSHVDANAKTHHALAPQMLLNIFANEAPPKNTAPYLKNKEYYDELSEHNSDQQNRVLTAFLKASTGVDLEIMEEQKIACNYFDDEGFLRFPFEQDGEIYIKTDFGMSRRDAPLPNRVSNRPSPGDNMLRCFWRFFKADDVVVAAEQASINSIASRRLEKEMADYLRKHGNSMSFSVMEQTRRALIGQIKKEGRPEFFEFKSSLLTIFDERTKSRNSAVSSLRMAPHSMLMGDSLEMTAIDHEARQQKAKSSSSSEQRTRLADEDLAVEVNKVFDFVQSGARLLKAGDATEYKDILADAIRETTEWTLRCFNEVYMDPKNDANLWPAAVSIWRTTMTLIKQIPDLGRRYLREHCGLENAGIEVDKNHPDSSLGSINFAAAHEFDTQVEGLTAWGNWRHVLDQIYGPGLAGIQGRRGDIRRNVHASYFAPAGPKGIREMIMIGGKRGRAKSFQSNQIRNIFNRTDDESIKREWARTHGAASNTAYNAGGLTPGGGGVVCSDEALKEICSQGSGKDDALLVQRQALKSFCTEGESTRPRTQQVVDNNGQVQYCVVNHVQLSNETRLNLHNLGASCTQPTKNNTAPDRPDEDRNALIDRCLAMVATESATTQTKGTELFKVDAMKQKHLLTAHTLVSSLTYMLMRVGSLVHHLRPAGGGQLEKMFGVWNTWMDTEHNIPQPDPRRRELCRNDAYRCAFEAAVAELVVFRADAFKFECMLPTSKPFSNTHEGPRVHTVAPFSWSHLVTVFERHCYDQEVALEAFSGMLDRNIWTAVDVHHTLFQLASRVGIQAMTQEQTLVSNYNFQKDDGSSPTAEFVEPPTESAEANALAERFPSSGVVASQPRSEDQSSAPASAPAGRTGFDVSELLKKNRAKKRARESDAKAQSEANAAAAMEERARQRRAATDAQESAASVAALLNQAENVDADNSANTSSAMVVDDGTSGRTPSVQAHISGQLDAQIKSNSEKSISRASALDRVKVERRRHQVLSFFARLRLSVCSNTLTSHPTVMDYVKHYFGTHFGHDPQQLDDEVTLPMPWGEGLTVRQVFDLVLPTVSEVLDCGYDAADLVKDAWLDGKAATAFSSKDRELIVLGLRQNTVKFDFLRRKPSSTSSGISEALDTAWRKVVLKSSDVVPEAVAGQQQLSTEEHGNGSSTAMAVSGDNSAYSAAGGGGGGGGGNYMNAIWNLSKSLAGDKSGDNSSSSDESSMDWNFDKLWYFDRIVQILMLEREKFPLISVNPEPGTETRRLSPMQDGSVIRIEENTNDADVAGKELKEYRFGKGFNPILQSATILTKILPVHAAGWRTTAGTKNNNHNLEKPRNSSLENIGMQTNSLAQCRLDLLLNTRSLPAVDTITVANVERGLPLRQNGNELFFNSGFMVRIVRFNTLVNNFMATIPGLRQIHMGDDEEEAKDKGKGKATPGAESNSQIDNVARSQQGENAAAACQSKKGGELRNNSSLQRTIKEKAKEINERRRNKGRVRDVDVDDCVENLHFVNPQSVGANIFDKTSIFYTFSAHEFFNFFDKPYFDLLVKSFPAVFNSVEEIVESSCESSTRFLSYKGHITDSIADGDTALVFSVSAQRKLDPPAEVLDESESNPAPAKRQRSKFNVDTMLYIQAIHYKRTGEWIENKDVQRLTEVGTRMAGSVSKDEVVFTDREKWRNAILQEKLELGMIKKDRDYMGPIISDSGTGFLSKVVRTLALNDSLVNSSRYAKAAAHMRPYNKSQKMLLTCRQRELENIKMQLDQSVAFEVNGGKRVEKTTTAHAEGPDFFDENAAIL
jgi:hypothetical protein